MADAQPKSWLRGRIEKALSQGLTRAYSTVQVDPDKFLLQLRTAYRMPISGYHGVYSLEMGELDVVADEIIRSGMKLAAVEVKLSAEERERLDKVSQPTLLYPYWHQMRAASDRLGAADLALLAPYLKK